MVLIIIFIVAVIFFIIAKKNKVNPLIWPISVIITFFISIAFIVFMMVYYKPDIPREAFISTIQMHAYMGGLFSVSVVGLALRKAIKKKKEDDLSSKDDYLFSDRKKSKSFYSQKKRDS